MAFTFPTSPTVGQIFSSGNVAWQWDGQAWRGTSTSGINFLRSDQSGTISGSLTVNGNTISANSVTIGTGGQYLAGSIYSDANWGMLFRARQASPVTADFRWANSADVERMRIDTAGTVVVVGSVNPSVTNAYDLGTASLRWRNIFTQDLHLSNGIGDYTVVEGEENLYLVNNKTNKSFKFALIEVDPAEVPPRSAP